MQQLKLEEPLRKLSTPFYKKNNISVVSVKNPQKGFEIVSEVLSTVLDKKTVLFLSGGKTPKELYELLSKEQKLHPGAVALVDERYGEKFHENSNELMMRNAGLLTYLSRENIQFYPILEKDKNLEQTAKDYDETLRYLFNYFQKSVAILGVGLDGHTAGLPASPSLWREKITKESSSRLAVDYDDSEGFYNKRVTMTFPALSMIDVLIVLVFGKDKKKALKLMFSDGTVEEVPSRFLQQEDIAPKTLFITDQKV